MIVKVLVISSYDDAWNAVRPEGEIFIGLHQQDDFEVTIMTQGDAPYAKRFLEMGLRVIDFHPSGKFDSNAVKRIRRELKEGGYHIMHLFNNKAIVTGNMAAIGLPVKVVTYRGYTGNINWYDPICYLTHLNPRVDKIVCLADSVRDHIRANMFFRSKDVAQTINKGHDLSWFAGIQPGNIQQFGIPKGAFTVGCVANAARRMKGIPYLIEATKYLSLEDPIHILLIGSGMDHPRVLKVLKDTPYKDRIHFAGFRKDALELISACDAAVLPSLFGEATPKAVLESMYLGVPTIMTSISGNKGMAIDKESALIVPPRDAKAIAEAILFYYQKPSERKKIGKEGQRYIAEHISQKRSIKEYGALYKELASQLPS